MNRLLTDPASWPFTKHLTTNFELSSSLHSGSAPRNYVCMCSFTVEKWSLIRFRIQCVFNLHPCVFSPALPLDSPIINMPTSVWFSHPILWFKTSTMGFLL